MYIHRENEERKGDIRALCLKDKEYQGLLATVEIKKRKEGFFPIFLEGRMALLTP